MIRRSTGWLCVVTGAMTLAALMGKGPASGALGTSTTTSSYYDGVACPTSLVCVAVGAREVDRKGPSGDLEGGSFTAIAARSIDGGMSWVPLSLAGVSAVLDSVSCGSATRCVAAGATQALVDGSWSPAHAVVVTFSGATAQRTATLPAGALALGAVSCTSATSCVAVGGSRVPGSVSLRPQVLVSHDGGSHWAAAPLPIVSGEVQGVACRGSSTCVAVGATIHASGVTVQSRPIALFSSDGGGSWTAAAVPDGAPTPKGGGPDAVACVSAASCIAVGDIFDWCLCGTGAPGAYGQTWTTGNGGKTWAFHPLHTVSGYDVWYSNAVSCWGPTSCAMVATGTTTKPRSLYYALFLPVAPATGGVAGAQTTSSNGLRPQYMYGLDCYASGQCVAVGQNWLNPRSAAIETSSNGKWATTFT